MPTNENWWPNQLNLKVLHQNSPLSDPMGEGFNYAAEFKTLDLDALRKDIDQVMTSRSQSNMAPMRFICFRMRSMFAMVHL